MINRAIDWSRARTLRHEVGADAGPEAATPPAAGSAKLGDDVMAALMGLDADQRACVVLRYVLEFTPGESAAPRRAPGTVNSRLRRGLDALGGVRPRGRRAMNDRQLQDALGWAPWARTTAPASARERSSGRPMPATRRPPGAGTGRPWAVLAVLSVGTAGATAASSPDSGVGRWVRSVLGVGAEHRSRCSRAYPGRRPAAGRGGRQRLGRIARGHQAPPGLLRRGGLVAARPLRHRLARRRADRARPGRPRAVVPRAPAADHLRPVGAGRRLSRRVRRGGSASDRQRRRHR